MHVRASNIKSLSLCGCQFWGVGVAEIPTVSSRGFQNWVEAVMASPYTGGVSSTQGGVSTHQRSQGIFPGPATWFWTLFPGCIAFKPCCPTYAEILWAAWHPLVHFWFALMSKNYQQLLAAMLLDWRAVSCTQLFRLLLAAPLGFWWEALEWARNWSRGDLPLSRLGCWLSPLSHEQSKRVVLSIGFSSHRHGLRSWLVGGSWVSYLASLTFFPIFFLSPPQLLWTFICEMRIIVLRICDQPQDFSPWKCFLPSWW